MEGVVNLQDIFVYGIENMRYLDGNGRVIGWYGYFLSVSKPEGRDLNESSVSF